MDLKKAKTLFLVAGIYDLILGPIYFFGYQTLFDMFALPAAGHPTYVQFPALLITIFGVMFLQISTDPVKYRSMIPYGMALKVGFVGLAIWSVLTVGLASVWLLIALLDFLFLIAFILAWRSTSSASADQ